MVITPDQYGKTPVYDLLQAAASGMVGVDHRLLHSIINRGDAAIDDAVRFGLEVRAEDRVNLDEDLLAIFQFTGSPRSLPFLVEYLRREPVDPPEDVIHAFLRIGQPAIQPLLDLYAELGPENGGDVAFTLAAMHSPDPRILKLLEERMDIDPGDAAFLMGVHGNAEAKPLLLSLKKQAASDTELAAAIGKEVDEALATLENPTPREIPEPVSIWDVYPDHIEPVFDVMTTEERLEFLRCSSAELRADAASSFIDREVPEEAQALLVHLASNDPNVGVRAVACEALSPMADQSRVFSLLLDTLKNTKKLIPERCGALLALAPQAREHPEIRQYIEEFYANPSTIARAVEAMWRSLDPYFSDYFRRHATDADIDVRRQAIKGIGYCEIGSEAHKLTELFQDEEFRLDALFSYALAVPVKQLRRGDMPQILKKIESLAGGLSDSEGEIVEAALDSRLMRHGMEPVFLPVEEGPE